MQVLTNLDMTTLTKLEVTPKTEKPFLYGISLCEADTCASFFGKEKIGFLI